MKKFLININGELFDEETAKISVFDRGFLYADSVYEATRSFNRKVFRLPLHLERLFESAKKIELTPSYSRQEINDQIQKTVKQSPFENISIRIVLTRGTNRDLGLDPSLCSTNNLIIITKEIADNPKWWLEQGLKVVLFQKNNTETGPIAKTGNYQENMLAFKFSKEHGADDALMLNPKGQLCEGTTSNVWIIKDNIVKTPPLHLGILDGLTRQALFEVCRRHSIHCHETVLTQQDLLNADEVFITSTTRNLVPITTIENKAVADGLPGSLTLKLLGLYLEFVAKEY